jgi:hypothetical protein
MSQANVRGISHKEVSGAQSAELTSIQGAATCHGSADIYRGLIGEGAVADVQLKDQPHPKTNSEATS